jgi:hypothetical protein
LFQIGCVTAREDITTLRADASLVWLIAMNSSGPSSVAAAYFDHFTADDLRLIEPGWDGTTLSQVSPPSSDRLDELLRSPQVFGHVFAAPTSGDPLLAASPFFVFAVAVHRAAEELNSASYVSEWLGLGRRAPLFDVERLRGFMVEPWHRLFLVELLASYTHVSSGSVLVRTRRGFRRQRYSELDPVRLAALLEVVPEAEWPGVLRRLGDLALFLTGVFPDHVARRGFGPIDEGRLLRSGGRGPRQEHRRPQRSPGLGDRGAVGLLEQLGQEWYRHAYELLPHPVAANVAIIGELPDKFDEARRMLGFITERFLFPHRETWFGISKG